MLFQVGLLSLLHCSLNENINLGEISGSYVVEYEEFFGCCTVQSGRNLLTF
jgi:hypothetical protein